MGINCILTGLQRSQFNYLLLSFNVNNDLNTCTHVQQMSRTAVAELAVQVGMWAQTQDFDEEQ